jgi:carbonic anhydrase/acetyltransferase-like protein (isoleucine patch superfamily)
MNKLISADIKKSNLISLANSAGHIPRVDDKAFVHESTQVIGNVRIGRDIFVGPVAVIRADEPDDQGQVQSIVIKPQCNIQDGVIMHALGGSKISIGIRTSVSHGAVVHGPCKIGSNCFVGFRAVVFNAILGNCVYVGSGAVVQNVSIRTNALVPPGSVIVSQKDADQLGRIGPQERLFMETVVRKNSDLVKGYSRLRAAMKRT